MLLRNLYALFVVTAVALLCCSRSCWAAAAEDRLLEWLMEHGGSVKGVGIAEFDGMGRGIAAVRNVREGDDILKIPSTFQFYYFFLYAFTYCFLLFFTCRQTYIECKQCPSIR